MRILDKYLLKALTMTFLAVLTVLLLITFGSEATKLLAMAVEGKLPSSVVFQVLLLKIPPALEIIFPLVALLSVMLSMGRLYQDQEMGVLSSCGVSPRYFKLITLVFLLPLALFMAWVSLVVTPWSIHTERVLIEQAKSATPVSGLVAGRFNILPNNSGVFYTKGISPSGELSTVWIQRQTEHSDMILMAPTGRFEYQSGHLVLVLEHGMRYQGMHLSNTVPPPKVMVQKFSRLEVVIPELSTATSRPAKYERSTSELWGAEGGVDQALLQWRLVTPFSVLVLGLIGLKMSKTGPRQGRFAKIFLALVLYIVYSQLLVVGRDGISDGSWSSTIGLWPIPLGFLLFALWDRKRRAGRRVGLAFLSHKIAALRAKQATGNP